MKPTLILLAAGMGSRYGGLKQVDAVGPSGETIMDYSIFDAVRAGFGKILFVIRKEIESEFQKAFTDKLKGKVDFDFVYQELESVPDRVKIPGTRIKPWGTGHAVLVAAEKVKEPFAVINADDFYGYDAYLKMEKFLSESKENNSYSMIGYSLKNTLSDFGYVSRGICLTDDQLRLTGVTERTRIRKNDGNIFFEDEKGSLIPLCAEDIVSMNFWGFKPEFFNHLRVLFEKFFHDAPDIEKSEFYLSSAIDQLIHEGKVTVSVLPTPSQWFGVTYKEDKPEVTARIKTLIRDGAYPKALWK